jgi:endogenous inhibitor of DNA gyrase (YacG/DUF329 family)
MPNITCNKCGKKFHVPPSRVDIVKFCSENCKKEYRKQLRQEITCTYCGKLFEVYKHELPRKKYCSVECRDKALERFAKQSCCYCGKEVFRKPSRAKTQNVFCSKECLFEYMKKREARTCTVCGKKIERQPSQFKKYALCSPECNSIFQSERISGERHFSYNSVKRTCEVCGKEFAEPKSRVEIGKGRFCSRKCKYIYFSKHFEEFRNPNWKGGSTNYRGPNWEEQRKKAMQRDNFTCQLCGSTDKLQVHHIRPYRVFNGDYKKANALTNLITLCLSCHLKIEPRIKPNGNTEVTGGIKEPSAP